ncbi:HNH endonuclease [Pseudoalteromonas shioyasakiensis]|uniref:HNH endonuclease n=1 Tax=Pseudoalteromonas shioyasakiensis TaxID=1190813 RepID=UPI001EFC699D|nr:HNH endonuclease [Pseudoalteromonas shioyasakiensis]MCG9735712.1 HNH endonuclease [Pseudoalteromonas shioyasakiensis]
MKGKSTKNSRLKLAKYLNEHLCSFGDGFENKVICPTCVKEFDLNSGQRSFTAGHILPEASGGSEWTFLCKDCNSQFGEKQDKWLGEYLNILNKPTGMLLDAKTKSRYISINDKTVNGSISVSDVDGGIDIVLPINRNPPGKVESMKFGENLEINFEIPLTLHENEIAVGYITAAYLMWFNEIGYNWVFQSSLDNVRKQILNCDRDIDGAKVIDLPTDKMEMQGVGVIINSGTLYPCCVVVDKFVIFPTPPTVSSPTPKNVKFESPCNIEFLNLAVLNFPYLTLFDEYHVVVPNRLKKCPPIPDKLFNIHSELGKEAGLFSLVNEDMTNFTN